MLFHSYQRLFAAWRCEAAFPTLPTTNRAFWVDPHCFAPTFWEEPLLGAIFHQASHWASLPLTFRSLLDLLCLLCFKWGHQGNFQQAPYRILRMRGSHSNLTREGRLGQSQHRERHSTTLWLNKLHVHWPCSRVDDTRRHSQENYALPIFLLWNERWGSDGQLWGKCEDFQKHSGQVVNLSLWSMTAGSYSLMMSSKSLGFIWIIRSSGGRWTIQILAWNIPPEKLSKPRRANQ